MRVAEELYRALLRLYPGDFLRENGPEMQSTFVRRLQHVRQRSSPGAAFALCMYEFADAILTALRERRVARFTRTRSRSMENVMATLLQDIRYALRSLLKTPVFTAVVILTLALGIGANTAIFSVVNGVLLRPLPFDRPDELAMIWEHNYLRGQDRNVVNQGNFTDWRERSTTFRDMASVYQTAVNLTGSGDPERISATMISPSFLSVLGLAPALGRGFTSEEGDVGEVVILGHGFWVQRFGEDEEVLGRTILLNERPHTIVGVMPSGFDFPSGTALWTPLVLSDWHARQGRWMSVVGRLDDGISLEQARAEMARMGTQLEEEYPDFNGGWTVNVVGMLDQLAGSVRPALLVMLGAVGLVLFIACANVANLLLGRGADSAREVAIRAALGAGRGRIIRQLLTESALLTTVAAVSGLALGVVGLRTLIALAPEGLPRIGEVSIDGTVLGFTLGASVVTGLLFGVLPALQTSKTDIQATLKEGGRTNTGGARARLRSALVVSEIALAMVLLTGAGLLTRSFRRVMAVDAGMDVERVLSARVQPPGARYQSDAEYIDFFSRLTENLEQLPGITSASTINFLPLSGPGSATSFWVNDRPTPESRDQPVTDVRSVRPGYFSTMGIPLLEGRDFDGSEQAGADMLPIVINQWMAEHLWPGESALSKTITMPWGEDLIGEVIGVAGNVPHGGPETEPRAKTYWAYNQFTWPFEFVVIRTTRDPASFANAMREQVWALDPDIPVASVETMTSRLGTAVAQRRFNTLLLATFAGVAVLLACVGIYGVMSYTVSQRTHELGLRVALGAQPGRLLGTVVGQGMLLTSVAVAFGMVASVAASKLMSSLVFEISPSDPATLATTAVMLALVASLACYVPARRAAKADPMLALRSD